MSELPVIVEPIEEEEYSSDSSPSPDESGNNGGLVQIEPETEIKTVDESDLKDDETEYSSETADLEELVPFKEAAKSKYYYNKLDDSQKEIYAQILYTLKNFENNVEVNSLDISELDRIFRYVVYDFPEIFYVEGCSYVKYEMGGELFKITISGMYTYTQEQAQAFKPAIEEYKKAFEAYLNSNYPGSTDSYDIIKAAYEFIILNTEYEENSPDNQNIISVICNGKSVCLGISKTFKLLMDSFGIESAVIGGKEASAGGHAWNLVRSNADYYYVDVTWGGQSYRVTNDNVDPAVLPKITYDYLLVDDAFLDKTHQKNEPEILPNCTSSADNYYVREKLLFSGPDTGQLENAFGRAYAEGKENLTIKMAGSEAYEQMKDYLLTQQHIFDYLQGITSVTFIESPDIFTMTFWI